jgi:hypothetical protein
LGKDGKAAELISRLFLEAALSGPTVLGERALMTQFLPFLALR